MFVCFCVCLFFQTVIENVVMSEIYKSSHELLNHVLRENTHSIEGGLSFNFGISPSLSIGAGEITAGVGAKLGVEASVEVGHETTDMVKTILESTDMKVFLDLLYIIIHRMYFYLRTLLKKRTEALTQTYQLIINSISVV